MGILAIYVATYLTWRKVDLSPINTPAILIFAGLGIYIVAYSVYADANKDLTDVPRIELELELMQERKRLYAVALNLDLETRQLIYRDSVPQEVDQFRSESQYYRRIHNTLRGDRIAPRKPEGHCWSFPDRGFVARPGVSPSG